MQNLVSPAQWIAERIGNVIPVRPPMLYVAAPVAPQPGEVLARCTECSAVNTFAPGDAVDLRLVCDHDAPVRQVADRDAIVQFNLARALRWWRWLHLGLPEVTWIMPWYDAELIERGLRDDCEVARRCDGLMAVGPRISSGMRREANAVADVGGELFQLQGINREPPRAFPAPSVPWQRWRP
jgi:hypothetical protein